MLKKFSSGKTNSTKNALSFFRELQLITVVLLTCDSYMSYNVGNVIYHYRKLFKYIAFRNHIYSCILEFLAVMVIFRPEN